ncbi:MAG TPA: PGPGW domain-containing protein [Candidatus Aquilonibacter sp.]|nr:PGPGW domain-containing protein [Candidatus Aquilonibacter sp.]
MLIRTVEQAKRWLKIIVGFTLLVLGLAMVFSPAPGLLIMLVGLGILAAEFVWAKRLLNHLKEQSERFRQTVFTRADKAA